MADVPEDEVYGHIPHDPAQYKKFEQVPPYWQGVIEDVHDVSDLCTNSAMADRGLGGVVNSANCAARIPSSRYGGYGWKTLRDGPSRRGHQSSGV